MVLHIDDQICWYVSFLKYLLRNLAFGGCWEKSLLSITYCVEVPSFIRWSRSHVFFMLNCGFKFTIQIFFYSFILLVSVRSCSKCCCQRCWDQHAAATLLQTSISIISNKRKVLYCKWPQNKPDYMVFTRRWQSNNTGDTSLWVLDGVWRSEM